MKKYLQCCAIFLALALCLSMTAISAVADTPVFSDVEEQDYFYPAVQWGLEEGITYGVDEEHFAPAGEVTRAQVVSFLWRMAGEPEPTVTETFSDVEAGSWYETAVQWAVENGITAGTGDGKFSPDVVCDRAMCISLLYRLNGSSLDGIEETAPDEVGADATLEEFGAYFSKMMITGFREMGVFSDVTKDDYYELPVIWASYSGIITQENTGITEAGGKFRATDPCVRAEMISFLYQTKLLQDAANAPDIYEYGDVSIAIPKEYENLLYREIYATGDDEDGELIAVSELASREAAEAMGEDPEGAGELFRIVRVDADTLHEMLCSDMSGREVFAQDANGKYYLYCHPTDVRYMRESAEQMEQDQEQWSELNSWAYGVVRDDILRYSKGLSAVTYTNTAPDIYLARAAYDKDVKYTVSTTEFGPLEPGKVDAAPYVEFLLRGNFMEAEDKEVPDGEYVVLNFPDEEVRFDFFKGEPNLVRGVFGDYEMLYERSSYHSISNTEVMQGWYDALAVQAGKKEADKSLDAFLDDWHEEIAGRGMLTITKSVAPGKVQIEASWPDSAAVMHTWHMTAQLDEDGKLLYTDGVHTVTEFDETGEGKVIEEETGESGSIVINDEGKLVWNYQIGDQFNEGIFLRNE